MSSVNDYAGRTKQARLRKIAILLTVALRIAGAQTQLDLGRQGKDVDFATAQSTRPAQTGTVLPPNCSVGQLFYKANAAAGNNLFGCTATDTWTVLGSALPAIGTQLGDFQITASGTTLTVGAGCSNTLRCNARFVETTASFSSPATVTVSAGTGTARIYIDGSSSPGALHVRSSGLTVSCAGMNCTTDTGAAFPSNSIPLYTWTATSGVWDPAGGQDFRAILSSYQVTAGPGIVVSQTGGNAVFTVDTAVVPTFLTASATIATFPAISAGACSTDQTFTLSGALTNDGVSPGWPAGMTAGLVGTMRISAANTVAVRLCNFSGATITPASATYRATIVRSF